MKIARNTDWQVVPRGDLEEAKLHVNDPAYGTRLELQLDSLLYNIVGRIVGWRMGSLFKSLDDNGRHYSLNYWMCIAYAAWADDGLRAGMMRNDLTWPNYDVEHDIDFLVDRLRLANA